MSKLLLSFAFSFLLSLVLLTTIPQEVVAQKSVSLEEQSQHISRTDDVVQVTTTTKSDRATQSSTSASLSSAAASTRSASANSTTSGTINIPTGFAPHLSTYINWLLSAVIVLALFLAFFNFIVAGIEWITSGGDKSKTDNARSRITSAFIGVIILASSYAIVQFVAYLLGFESLNDALNSIGRIQ